MPPRPLEGIPLIATAILGTAHLFGSVPPPQSHAVLRAALDAGYRSFDTAPSYGFGDSEAALGRMLGGLPDIVVTTKVGLEPPVRPTRATRMAKAMARRLPRAVQERVQAGRAQPRPALRADAVRDSVERSLRRLGRVDRLLVHEARPEDLGDDVLAVLARVVDSGDVQRVGVATANELTAACVARAPELLTTANISISPTSLPLTGRSAVAGVELVGHGAFGADAADLRRLHERLRADAALAARWQSLTSGTEWGRPDAPATALLRRAAAQVPGVIVATSRPSRLAGTRAVVESGTDPGIELRHLIEAILIGPIGLPSSEAAA